GHRVVPRDRAPLHRDLARLRRAGAAAQRHLRGLLVHLLPPRQRRTDPGSRGPPGQPLRSQPSTEEASGRDRPCSRGAGAPRRRGDRVGGVRHAGRAAQSPSQQAVPRRGRRHARLPDHLRLRRQASSARGRHGAGDHRCPRPDRAGRRRAGRELSPRPDQPDQEDVVVVPLQQHPSTLRAARLHLRPAEGAQELRHGEDDRSCM
ncbi:MAG: Acetyltransferase, GNAT family, partial [uncultured Friedmanniella sp.]